MKLGQTPEYETKVTKKVGSEIDEEERTLAQAQTRFDNEAPDQFGEYDKYGADEMERDLFGGNCMPRQAKLRRTLSPQNELERDYGLELQSNGNTESGSSQLLISKKHAKGILEDMEEEMQAECLLDETKQRRDRLLSEIIKKD
jgi:hypothetical protein